MKLVNTVYLLFGIQAFIGCSTHDEDTELLSLPVMSTVSITDKELKEYQNKIQQNTNNENLRNTITQIWEQDYPSARTAIYSIKKLIVTNQIRYVVTLVFDDIPDDDSISGYRYDLHIQNPENNVFKLIKFEESWRCWPERGHRYFSADPCK